MESLNLIESFIEIEPVDSDTFLKIKETLTRIGIASRKAGGKPILWQSCHILHKRGRYYIVHFKQMFLLDGRTSRTSLSDDDYTRVRVVANLLSQWGLVTLKSHLNDDKVNINLVVIPFSKKGEWELCSKYNVGKKD